MPSMGFESTISPGERPQTYALDRAATGTVRKLNTSSKYFKTDKYTLILLMCFYIIIVTNMWPSLGRFLSEQGNIYI